MLGQEDKKTTNANDMLQKLDSHYEIEERLKKELNERWEQLRILRQEIDMMQTLILFQMKKEIKKNE